MSTDVTELILSKFVAAIDIDVLGCYKVNPRRTHFQRVNDIYPDRSTFRVCIPREDSKRFLEPKEWPAHISVSWWTFKKIESDVNAVTLDSRQQATSREIITQRQRTPQGGTTSSSCVAMADPAGSDIDRTLIGKNIVMSTPLKIVDTAQLSTAEDMDATIIINNDNA